jgi:hypothetical protein
MPRARFSNRRHRDLPAIPRPALTVRFEPTKPAGRPRTARRRGRGPVRRGSCRWPGRCPHRRARHHPRPDHRRPDGHRRNRHARPADHTVTGPMAGPPPGPVPAKYIRPVIARPESTTWITPLRCWTPRVAARSSRHPKPVTRTAPLRPRAIMRTLTCIAVSVFPAAPAATSTPPRGCRLTHRHQPTERAVSTTPLLHALLYQASTFTRPGTMPPRSKTPWLAPRSAPIANLQITMMRASTGSTF